MAEILYRTEGLEKISQTIESWKIKARKEAEIPQTTELRRK